MKKVKDQLKSVSKSLATLSKQLERISKQVDKLQTPKVAANKKTTKVKKTAAAMGTTVLDSVFDIIKRSKKGVAIAKLKEKTKLDARQLSNALYKLSNKGKIKAISRGVYMKK